MVLPRWTRDGGVTAHVAASARALLEAGTDVTLLVARREAEPPSGIELLVSPRLYDRSASVRERLGPAFASEAVVAHLHQLGDREVVAHLRGRSPVVISAHGFLACTSGVHYFGPGEECRRAHGPGCVARLPRCAHTRKLRVLPGAYRDASRELAALMEADLAISYSSAVDRHLQINGVHHRRIVPYFPTVPSAQRVAAAQPRVLFVGRVVPPKGLTTLVRAMREVDGELVVCGDGHALPAARRLTQRLGLERRVHFRGWLEPEQLAREFADCALVAVPSVWPEPFGIVGIEGFAACRPAVASDTGGIGDWLQDGVSGVLVPAGDAGALSAAVTRLLKDPELAANMGAAGRESVTARFTRERHLTALSDAYAQAERSWSSDESREPRLAVTA